MLYLKMSLLQIRITHFQTARCIVVDQPLIGRGPFIQTLPHDIGISLCFCVHMLGVFESNHLNIMTDCSVSEKKPLSLV